MWLHSLDICSHSALGWPVSVIVEGLGQTHLLVDFCITCE